MLSLEQVVFFGLPGGSRGNLAFMSSGLRGLWWSTTESGTYAWFRRLERIYISIYRNYAFKSHGVSVRCLKD